MTKHDFELITSCINREASRQGIELADRANTFTVWFEHPKGSGEYVLHGKAASLEQAKALAGRLEVVIRTTQSGRVQLIVWKDGKWLDDYADDRPIGSPSL